MCLLISIREEVETLTVEDGVVLGLLSVEWRDGRVGAELGVLVGVGTFVDGNLVLGHVDGLSSLNKVLSVLNVVLEKIQKLDMDELW